MDEVNFKDIRVLPTSLNIKSNIGKSLAEILPQLQSGLTVKGLVVETNLKGEVIFDTPYGKFSIPNRHNLVSGDNVSLKFENVRGEASASILSINNKKTTADGELKLELVRPVEIQQNKLSLNAPLVENSVTVKNIGNMPKAISGTVSYLNLSGIDKSSFLFKEINHATTQNSSKLPITANVVFNNKSSPDAFTFNGVVSDNGKEGEQLIRTAFGIITTQETKMPVGQKLVLEMTSINNQPIDKDITKTVIDLVFKIGSNDSLVKNLAPLLANNLSTSEKVTERQNLQFINTTQSNQVDTKKPGIGEVSTLSEQKNSNTISANNIETKSFSTPSALSANQLLENSNKLIGSFVRLEKRSVDSSGIELLEESGEDSTVTRALPALSKLKQQGGERNNGVAKSLNAIISLLGDMEEVKKLATDYQHIKELLTPFVPDEGHNLKWHSVFIPFHNGQKVIEQEVKIDRTREHYLRFIFNVEFNDNSMQIDGLIHFENNNKTPKTFDMTLRSKNKLDSGLRKRIADIYSFSQSMSGVKGALLIEDFNNLVEI